jgi:hypothetical protein
MVQIIFARCLDVKKALVSLFAVALLLSGAVSASADAGERGVVTPYDAGERG